MGAGRIMLWRSWLRMGSMVLTVLEKGWTYQRTLTMFGLEMKSLRMRIRMSILKINILKHLQKKKKDHEVTNEETKSREELKTESIEAMDNMEVTGEYFRTESIDNMMT